jgi:dolichol-phosphate mannosyltransferase
MSGEGERMSTLDTRATGVWADTATANGTTPRMTRPVVSVVVPTRDEAGNVEPLVERLARVIPEHPLEVIFVDDSEDGTDDVVRGLAQRPNCAVRLLHRDPADRWGGLGGAVVDGMRVARAGWVCVMDADLQHPPEVLGELVARASAGDVDLVVASRFCHDGHATEFGTGRACSRMARRGSRSASSRATCATSPIR